jgi:hypothetical protein
MSSAPVTTRPPAAARATPIRESSWRCAARSSWLMWACTARASSMRSSQYFWSSSPRVRVSVFSALASRRSMSSLMSFRRFFAWG